MKNTFPKTVLIKLATGSNDETWFEVGKTLGDVAEYNETIEVAEYKLVRKIKVECKPKQL